MPGTPDRGLGSDVVGGFAGAVGGQRRREQANGHEVLTLRAELTA